jgi:hypothetical protein
MGTGVSERMVWEASIGVESKQKVLMGLPAVRFG